MITVIMKLDGNGKAIVFFWEWSSIAILPLDSPVTGDLGAILVQEQVQEQEQEQEEEVEQDEKARFFSLGKSRFQ